jgi:thiol-disulfide isomerase/thioredoxin
VDAALRTLLLAVAWTALPAHAYEPEIGQVPAAIDTIEYVDGSALDLRRLLGKPVVLYIGADWCVPCVQRGRPATTAVAKRYGPLGLQVIFVSMDDNRFRPGKLEEARAREMLIAMPKLDICPPGKCVDGVRTLGKFGRLYTLPTAIVLDAQGVVRAKLERGNGVESNLDSAAAEVMKAAGLLTVVPR